MLNEAQLKEKLQAFAANEFRLSERDDLSDVIPAMLEHIGSTDSELRDELIYTAFATWILRSRALGPERLSAILPDILDENHLLYRIGETNTDSVFRRSFSILLLPLILIAHRSGPFLSAPDIRHIQERLLHLLANEKDLRGFVNEKGWAHCMAHAADALDDLAQCTELTQTDLAELLQAVRGMICVKETGYMYGEEERLATAVMAMIKRGLLPELDIIQWIQSLADTVLSAGAGPEKHILRSNVKNFLQSLYFRLRWEQGTGKFEAPIDQALQRINPFIKHEGG